MEEDYIDLIVADFIKEKINKNPQELVKNLEIVKESVRYGAKRIICVVEDRDSRPGAFQYLLELLDKNK